MKYGNLIIEKKEYVYLKRILNISGYNGDLMVKHSLHRLSEQLETAQVVDDSDVPLDIIRFNSIVSIRADTGEEREIQVVIPSQGNSALNKISVLKPMGAALIGYAATDSVLWNFPAGQKTITIIAVKRDANYEPLDIPI